MQQLIRATVLFAFVAHTAAFMATPSAIRPSIGAYSGVSHRATRPFGPRMQSLETTTNPLQLISATPTWGTLKLKADEIRSTTHLRDMIKDEARSNHFIMEVSCEKARQIPSQKKGFLLPQ